MQIDRIGVIAAIEHLVFKQKADIHLSDTLSIAAHLNVTDVELPIHGTKGQGKCRPILPVGSHIEPEIIDAVGAGDVPKRKGPPVIFIEKRGRMYNGLVIDSKALTRAPAGSNSRVG